MKEAAIKFECTYRTFTHFAKKYGLYRPAPPAFRAKIPLQEILEGKHPTYPTRHLSQRLVKEGIKAYRCEGCQITTYNGLHISLELDHIDGDSRNHLLNNLRLLCPNCHSQTPTYRSKKLTWRAGGEVYRAGLENRRTLTGPGGSNPSLSAV